MEERMMRRVADSAVIQTQLVLNSHLNGAGRFRTVLHSLFNHSKGV